MPFVRMFAVSLVLTLPCAAGLTPAQEWALATSAILTQHNGKRHDLLGGAERTGEEIEWAKSQLSYWWGVERREQLVETIESLERKIPDKATAGWNLPRAVILARWGYLAGYVNEGEAWDLIMPAARRAQSTFSSWQELGATYLEKRRAWAKDEVSSRYADWVYRVLVLDPKSPWRSHPWNLDLGDGQRVPASTDRTADLEVWARAGGLTCFRLRVIDTAVDDAWKTVMKRMEGCDPRVLSIRREGADGVFEGDCVQPNAARGAQLRRTLHMEPVVDALRHQGFTQLFFYIHYTPRGESEIRPELHDSWINSGEQTHVDMRWLRDPFPEVTLTQGYPPRMVLWFAGGAGFLAMVTFAWSFAMRFQLMRADRVARAHLLAKQWIFVRLGFWGGWLALSVVLNGLAIAGFWSGGEGLAADIRALLWYLPAAVAMRVAMELIVMMPVMKASAPNLGFYRVLRACFWRVMTEGPPAGVILLVSNPRNPLNLATLIVLVAAATAVSVLARRSWMLAVELQGGRARAGEFHDTVFAMAARAGAPLKRLYIIPDGPWQNSLPYVVSGGGLVIPERLLEHLSRREVNAVAAYALLMIKTSYLRRRDITLAVLLIIATGCAYLMQSAPSAPLSLLLVAVVLITGWAAYLAIVRGMLLKVEIATLEFTQDSEAWIAALAHVARLSNTAMDPRTVLRAARKAGIPPERLWALANSGLPESGKYPPPEFSREALVLPA